MCRKELKKEVEIEIQNLERLIKQMNNLLERLNDNPDFIQTRAAGSILHDFYCGIEKIFKRIALLVDKKMPSGEAWHRELLLRMAEPIEGIRGSVIPNNLMQKLKEYLRFRHLFRNIYGFDLKWKNFEGLCLEMQEVFEKLKESLFNFLEGR